MGAICGFVCVGDAKQAVRQGRELLEKLQVYSFDSVEELEADGVYFGCGIVYNTPESRHERLPARSGDGRFLLTADAIIDNREELIGLLRIDPSVASTVTDGELILRAYEKWGADCPERLIGDFAFAIWDSEKKELFCARDAVGQRTFYYMHEQGMFAFCTVEKPLLGVNGRKPELNEQWIAEFLAVDGILHDLQPSATVYEGIYQLPPATYGVFREEGYREVRYWDPLRDAKAIRFASDEEYIEAFNQIFAEAVACRTRSAGEVGIMLSGGLDSGAVACVAARQLQKSGRRLRAFSSIPASSFVDQPDRRVIFDESNEIGQIVSAYPNIEATYCRFEDRTCLTDMDKLIGIFEQPYKIFQNMTWYHPMLQLAVSDRCTVMLTGQSGNSTISYGNFRVHFLTLLRSGRWIACYREAVAFSRRVRAPFKRVLKYLLGVAAPYRIRLWRDRKRDRSYDRFQNSAVNRALAEKWDVESRLDDAACNMLTPRYLDYEEEKKFRANILAFSHIGAVETKLSLANRIAIRDPSRDRRVLEFCLSIPSEQFVRGGNERMLVRRAMEGILPDPIRLNQERRGVQSADWIHRLRAVRGQLAEELDRVFEDGVSGRFLDMDKLHSVRAKLDDGLDHNEDRTVRLAMVAIIFNKFLMEFNRQYAD